MSDTYTLRFIGGPYDSVQIGNVAMEGSPFRAYGFQPPPPLPSAAMFSGTDRVPMESVPIVQYCFEALFEDPDRGLIAIYSWAGPSFRRVL